MTTGILIQTDEAGLRSIIKEELAALLAQQQAAAKYYTRADIRELFKVSNTTIHTWINNGTLRAVKVGGRTLFIVDEVEQAAKDKQAVRYKHKRKVA